MGWPVGGIVGEKMVAFLLPADRPNSKEEKEDAGMRRWQCLRATGRQWNMTRGGGQRGWGEASGKRITQLEGGGGGQREASGQRTHNKRVVVTTAKDGGTRLCGCLPTSTPSRDSCHCAGRRRGRDLSSLKPGSNQRQLLMLTLYSIMVQPDKDIVIRDNI